MNEHIKNKIVYQTLNMHIWMHIFIPLRIKQLFLANILQRSQNALSFQRLQRSYRDYWKLNRCFERQIFCIIKLKNTKYS